MAHRVSVRNQKDEITGSSRALQNGFSSREDSPKKELGTAAFYILTPALMGDSFFLVLCFLTAWLIAYLDHRARFADLISDVPNLIVGMLFSAGILGILYSLLKATFEPN